MAQTTYVFEEISTISSKGQTTVPKAVRQALGVNEGDQIAFRVEETGITVRRAEEIRDDPAIASFLSFLSKDIQAHPEKLHAFPVSLVERIASLTKGIEFDPEAEIEGDVEL
ncbi:MAG TPA: type II toxin-antitoxin system PrlF family antitoxin [Bradyrhizobium sp.]|nr:type II toxin-antitoxin system PrlF family antitoxin [Bradyrhizobium sp.]